MSEPRATYAVTEWHGCYDDSWNGVLVPDAFAHPAKFAPGLISRILRHMLERGYIAPGDSIIDPFGGIAAGGYWAMLLGLHWTGVELEPRFVELGQRNIAKWQHDLRGLDDRLGTARLLQGDSRRLVEVVGGGMGAAGVVGSPPFEGVVNHDGGTLQGIEATNGRAFVDATYGDTPGQLGNMRGGFDAAVSSPPYADAVNNSGEGPGARHDPIYHNGDNAYKASSANGYGTTPGNLGSMAGEGFEAAVGSPPFGEAQTFGTAIVYSNGDRIHDRAYSPENQGDSPGNLAAESPDTFWAAARVIVEQTYQALRPGGYAAWVTKRFIRKGQIVEFSEQWAQLCEAVGFVRVEWVRAMLTEEHGHQLDIFGESHPKGIKRASFFRRLYEKKYPENAIDWEDVLIMRRPLFRSAQP